MPASASGDFHHVFRAKIARFRYTNHGHAAIKRLIQMSAKARPLVFEPHITINEHDLNLWEALQNREQARQLANEKLTGLIWLDVVQRDHALRDNSFVEPITKHDSRRKGVPIFVSYIDAGNLGSILRRNGILCHPGNGCSQGLSRKRETP